jgi:hypothetical protein
MFYSARSLAMYKRWKNPKYRAAMIASNRQLAAQGFPKRNLKLGRANLNIRLLGRWRNHVKSHLPVRPLAFNSTIHHYKRRPCFFCKKGNGNQPKGFFRLKVKKRPNSKVRISKCPVASPTHILTNQEVEKWAPRGNLQNQKQPTLRASPNRLAIC